MADVTIELSPKAARKSASKCIKVKCVEQSLNRHGRTQKTTDLSRKREEEETRGL